MATQRAIIKQQAQDRGFVGSCQYCRVSHACCRPGSMDELPEHASGMNPLTQSRIPASPVNALLITNIIP